MMPKDISIIYNYYKTKKRMPSYSEIAELFAFASKNAAHKKVEIFLQEGLLAKDQKGRLLPVKRMLEEYDTGLKLLGNVEAGFGSVEEEQMLDTITLDDWMIAHKEASFMLRVTGDSMKDAGIIDGDMVIVERTYKAALGSIVIAEIDGAWTIKYLRKDVKGFFLEPANTAYKVLRPKEDFKIAAKVVGVVRKYS